MVPDLMVLSSYWFIGPKQLKHTKIGYKMVQFLPAAKQVYKLFLSSSETNSLFSAVETGVEVWPYVTSVTICDKCDHMQQV